MVAGDWWLVAATLEFATDLRGQAPLSFAF